MVFTTNSKDIRCLDYTKLQKAGIKALAFDKDNTLSAPYEKRIHPEFMSAWNECRAVFGDRIVIVSNSAGSSDDPLGKEAQCIEKEINVTVLRHTKVDRVNLETS